MITTYDEIDNLPVGSVLMDASGDVLEIHKDDGLTYVLIPGYETRFDIRSIVFPVDLLYLAEV